MKMVKKFTKTIELELDLTPVHKIAEKVIDAIVNNHYQSTQGLKVNYLSFPTYTENPREPIRLIIYREDETIITHVHIHPCEPECAIEFPTVWIDEHRAIHIDDDLEDLLKKIIHDAIIPMNEQREEWIQNIFRMQVEFNMAKSLLNMEG